MFNHPVFSKNEPAQEISDAERMEMLKDWTPLRLIYEYDPERKHVLIYESRPEWRESSMRTHGINRKYSQQIANRMALPKDAGSFWGFRVAVLIYKDLESLVRDEEIVGAAPEFIEHLRQELAGKLSKHHVPELELKETP